MKNAVVIISKIKIDFNSWAVGKELKHLKLDREGTLILAIERISRRTGSKKFVGAPNGKAVLRAYDIVTCYGRSDAIDSLAHRLAGQEGDAQHMKHCKQLQFLQIAEETILQAVDGGKH